MDSVNILNIIESPSQPYVPANTPAHAQQEGPILALEENDRNVSQTIVHIIFGRQPRNHRLVVG